ncbi:MAG: hypothetical protein H6828_00060 [Planctomycetes bacterium]|nr:hypothetical protein [Planctomycetota bacterium]
MHSWVFRHRARLRLLYGLGPEPRRTAPVEREEREARAEPRRAAAGARRMRSRKRRRTPGTLSRQGGWVLVTPMARRHG